MIALDLEPVALAWTDWEGGFDIITLEESEITDRLSNYVITSKALDIPAGWAYTSLEEFVKRLDAELWEQQDGKLVGAVRDSNGLAEDAPLVEEEVEDDIET